MDSKAVIFAHWLDVLSSKSITSTPTDLECNYLAYVVIQVVCQLMKLDCAISTEDKYPVFSTFRVEHHF